MPRFGRKRRLRKCKSCAYRGDVVRVGEVSRSPAEVHAKTDVILLGVIFWSEVNNHCAFNFLTYKIEMSTEVGS